MKGWCNFMRNIEFLWDKNSITYDENNEEYNRLFIYHVFECFNDLIEVRGYLYLNAIYEMFGVAWDTDRENLYFRERIRFKVDKIQDGFLINVFGLEESA